MKKKSKNSRTRYRRALESLQSIIQQQALMAQQQAQDLEKKSASAGYFVEQIKDPVSVLTLNLMIISQQIENIYPLLCELEPVILKLPGVDQHKTIRRLIKKCSDLDSKTWRTDLLDMLVDSMTAVRMISSKLDSRNVLELPRRIA